VDISLSELEEDKNI